jgi:hypothetical protein
MFVVVDRFNKMCILMPCKKTIKGQEATNMFFEQVWVHFGIPRSIISDRIPNFSVPFGLHFGRRWTQVEEIYNFPSTDKWADRSSQYEQFKF